MARRATGGDDRGVRRLAAQLGLSAHMLSPSDSAPSSPADAPSVERPRADEQANEEDEVASEIEELNDGEQEEDDEDPGELSSDLSLPHSFGRYDGVRPAQVTRMFGGGISQFDDHLVAASNAQPVTSVRARNADSAGTTGGDTSTARSATPRSGGGTSASGSEALMKKFYEAQVGRVRAQLVLSTQTQRELERALQQERTDASNKLATLESRYAGELGNLKRENEQLKREKEELASRLHVEKQHVTSLDISDALAEQLARQPAESLSLREAIQLQVHSKVRRLERELETCRHELEGARTMSTASEKAATIANEDMERLRDAASARERKLLRDVELSEATRRELETQVTSLYEALSEMKSERETHDKLYRSQRQAMTAHEATRYQLDQAIEERDALGSQMAELHAKLSENNQKCALLAADKAFLQDAKTQLEHETAALRVKQQDLETQVREWQEKYDTTYGQSLVLQSETRLQFEKKLDDEMRKFMDVSRQEIERIRGNAQVVYERENRLLKDARDSALQQVETLEARLQTVQARLDEKVLESTRLESQHSTALAGVRNKLKMKHFEMNQLQLSLEEKTAELRTTRLEVDMLSRKLTIHKDEFSRLETTSSTKIAQLEAALELERSKLKEYELLEVDLDNAVLQTGEALSRGATNGSDAKSDSIQEAMTTFGAILTTTKRRFEQSVQLVQKVVKTQREALALTAKLKEADADRSRLEQQVSALNERLANLHQPQAYLIEKLTRKEEELQAATKRLNETEQRLQELRTEFRHTTDARNSLQRQLQQLLARHQDIDALKSTVLALRARLLHAGSLPPADENDSGNVLSRVPAKQPSVGSGESGYVKAPPSPTPSIASRMTQSPARLTSPADKDADAGMSDTLISAGDSTVPRWYAKLRS